MAGSIVCICKYEFMGTMYSFFFRWVLKKFRVLTARSNAGHAPFFHFFLVVNLPPFVARVWKQAKSGSKLATCSITISHLMLVENPRRNLVNHLEFLHLLGKLVLLGLRSLTRKLLSQKSHASIIKTLHILVYEI